MKNTRTSMWNSLLIGTVAALGSTTAQALPTTYTSRAAFDAAIAAILPAVNSNVINFESGSGGDLILSGGSFAGVNFSYALPGGAQIGVNSSPLAGTSGSNFLGVSNDAGASFSQFALGDQINFSFSASHAFGMYVIPVGGDTFDFFNNDVNLTFAGTTLSNVDADVASFVGANNVAALFVGIIDPAATYTTASLLFGPVGGPAGAPFFEIDDIVKTSAIGSGIPDGTVPEPTTLALLGAGMLGITLARRKKVITRQ